MYILWIFPFHFASLSASMRALIVHLPHQPLGSEPVEQGWTFPIPVEFPWNSRWIFCGFQLQMGIASETNQLLIWHHRDHHWFNQLSNQPLLTMKRRNIFGTMTLTTNHTPLRQLLARHIRLAVLHKSWPILTSMGKEHGWERNPPRKLLGFVGETWWNTLSFLSRKPSRQLQSPNPPFMNKSALSLRRWPGSMGASSFLPMLDLYLGGKSRCQGGQQRVQPVSHWQKEDM